jgi:hypothetical protein
LHAELDGPREDRLARANFEAGADFVMLRLGANVGTARPSPS